MRTKLALSILAFVAFLALPCRGWDISGYTWNRNRTVLMHLSLPPDGPLAGFVDGSASFNAVAEAALNLWNQHLVHMQFAVNRGSILPPSGTDGNTSVTMSNTVYGDSFGKGVLAVTLLGRRREEDIFSPKRMLFLTGPTIGIPIEGPCCRTWRISSE